MCLLKPVKAIYNALYALEAPRSHMKRDVSRAPRLDIGIERSFTGLTRAQAISRVVVGEDVHVQEVAHLASFQAGNALKSKRFGSKSL